MHDALSVLVTGSAGYVGRIVCAALVERGHAVRGLDLASNPDLADQVVADIADGPAVLDAMAGCDRVVHLAAYPDDADFREVLLRPNVMGLFNVFDAAREHAVSRLVFASTAQTVAGAWRTRRKLKADVVNPENHYALTKAWAEQMGAMYAHKYGMSILGVRIGWVVRNADEAANLVRIGGQKTYLSPGDTGRFFVGCVEARHRGYKTLYAIGPGGRRYFDLRSAKKTIGYSPADPWPVGIDPDWLP